MAVASEKVLWRVPPTILYISVPNGCCFIKNSLEGSANCALHLPPSLLLGSKLRELLTWVKTCQQFTQLRPQEEKIQSAENDPSCRCCWGILWAYFLLGRWWLRCCCCCCWWWWWWWWWWGFEGTAQCPAEQTKTLKQQIVVAERPLAQGEPVLALPLSHETQTKGHWIWWTFRLPTCYSRSDLVLNRCCDRRFPLAHEFGTEDMLDC